MTFKIGNNSYCMDKDYMVKVSEMCQIQKEITGPNYIPGKIQYNNIEYTVVDLCLLCGAKVDKSNIFLEMQEKHLQWVKTLENCVKEGIPFSLPKDPHKCSFGIWLDNFETSNFSINYVLKKIDEPHKNLHEQANIIEECKANKDKQGMEAALEKAMFLCHKVIIPLLDELIVAYDNNGYRLLLLIKINNKNFAFSVDEPGTVLKTGQYTVKDSNEKSPYLKNLIVTDNGAEYRNVNLQELSKLI